MTKDDIVSFKCPRCGGIMEWIHQTWQCIVCRFKIGCCEGEKDEPLYTSDGPYGPGSGADGHYAI